MAGFLEVRTLGGLTINHCDELVTPLSSRKVGALLVYLACTRREHPRDVLAEFFWEERSQVQAMANLRVVLHDLRRHLASYLIINRHSIGFNFDSTYHVDVMELELGLLDARKRLKQPNGSSKAAAEIEKTLTIYRGDFMSGFSLHNCPAFESWMLLERERIRHQVVESMHHLVEHYAVCGNFQAALAQAMRLLQLDPLREDTHRQVMCLLAETDQRSAALVQFETCRRLLMTELGLRPSVETKELREAIRDGLVSRRPSSARPVAVAPTSSTPLPMYQSALPVRRDVEPASMAWREVAEHSGNLRGVFE
jgi:DNA-binding SARP family transcriptional activator